MLVQLLAADVAVELPDVDAVVVVVAVVFVVFVAEPQAALAEPSVVVVLSALCSC